MRRLHLFFALLFFAALASFAERRAEAQIGSDYQVFSESGFDFQGIPRYTKPRHSFVFTNNGRDDLKLTGVRTSCQCTQVFIPQKRVYKTGEKGEVVAQIDAVRFTGARHATVTVTFERGGRSFEVPLNVTGVVIENARIEPDHLNFVVDAIDKSKPESAEASVRASASRSQNVSVQYPGSESVVRYDCSNPMFEVSLGKPTRVGVGTVTPIKISVREDAPAGYANATVRFWSNGPNGSSPLSLKVSGSVRGPLNASPSMLTFYASNGEKIVKNVVVSASNEFVLKKVECDSQAIKCNIEPSSVRPSKICVVPISFDPQKLQNESGSTRIRIETQDGRTLYLPALISSGNFDAAGLIQTDRDAVLE